MHTRDELSQPTDASQPALRGVHGRAATPYIAAAARQGQGPKARPLRPKSPDVERRDALYQRAMSGGQLHRAVLGSADDWRASLKKATESCFRQSLREWKGAHDVGANQATLVEPPTVSHIDDALNHLKARANTASATQAREDEDF